MDKNVHARHTDLLPPSARRHRRPPTTLRPLPRTAHPTRYVAESETRTLSAAQHANAHGTA
eukprot:338043-Prymnesium_polylepis.1